MSKIYNAAADWEIGLIAAHRSFLCRRN